MNITIKKIKAAKGKLVFEYDKKEDGNIPASAHKSTFPTGVSYSTGADDYEGAIITCEYHMPQSGTMTTINTPFFRFPQTDEQVGLPSYFDEETEKHLHDLVHEAVRYLEGHRGQVGLFDDEEQDPRNVTPEDSPVRLAAMGRSGTDIKQIAG